MEGGIVGWEVDVSRKGCGWQGSGEGGFQRWIPHGRLSGCERDLASDSKRFLAEFITLI